MPISRNASTGATATCCSGYAATPIVWRKTSRYFSRRSTTIRARDKVTKKMKRASGAGPRRKNGGGGRPATDIRGFSDLEDRSPPGGFRSAGTYSLAKMLPSLSIFSSAMPEPRTTQVSGIFGHHHWQARLFHQQAVEITQQGTAAGTHHPPLRDIGAQFRRCLLQCRLDGTDDAVQTGRSALPESHWTKW